MTDKYQVRVPGGYVLTVEAADERAAKMQALNALRKAGHSIDPKLTISDKRIKVRKVSDEGWLR
jgi:hypothetical protein